MGRVFWIAIQLTDAIKLSLLKMGYSIVADAGDLSLTGDILKFDSYILLGFFSNEIEAIIQLNLKLIENKGGNIIWSEVISGSARKRLWASVEDRKEVIEKAIDNLINKLYTSTTFKKAIEKNPA